MPVFLPAAVFHFLCCCLYEYVVAALKVHLYIKLSVTWANTAFMPVIGCFLPRIWYACVSTGCMYSFKSLALTPWTWDVGCLPKGLLAEWNVVHVHGLDTHVTAWVMAAIGDHKMWEGFSLIVLCLHNNQLAGNNLLPRATCTHLQFLPQVMRFFMFTGSFC